MTRRDDVLRDVPGTLTADSSRPPGNGEGDRGATNGGEDRER